MIFKLILIWHKSKRDTIQENCIAPTLQQILNFHNYLTLNNNHWCRVELGSFLNHKAHLSVTQGKMGGKELMVRIEEWRIKTLYRSHKRS